MNTASKGRLQQQMRLYDKIRKVFGERISPDARAYFFLLHLVSGILQAQEGGLTAKEFTEFPLGRYRDELSCLDSVLPEFFKNEGSSLLGRLRIRLFVWALRRENGAAAGRLMGAK